MPYLPIDPMDLGRSYEAVIRVNSQSGKGGIAYLLEAEFGINLPRRAQIEFSQVVQAVTDQSGKEVTAADIWNIFSSEYLQAARLLDYVAHFLVEDSTHKEVDLTAEVLRDGNKHKLTGRGNGPIDAFVQAVARLIGENVSVVDYHEHAIGKGADAKAVTYIELKVGEGRPLFGVGIDSNIVTASLKAIVSGLNRSARQRAASESAARAVA
jgi:2-isopropylmalate synthase